MTSTVRTTCPYCGVGCGVLATPRRMGAVDIAGDPQHPANFGRLCSKGSALGETLALDGRLLHPLVREPESGSSDPGGPVSPQALRQVSWDAALDTVASGLSRIVAEHGPDSVALYVSGQLLTEDYYVANKLMKGYIGSANIDTNSRLCMASAVAGHKRAFGEDLVPVEYRDLELADLVVLVGSNTAWCHPVLFQRIAKAKESRPEMKVVVIDPRRTATCDIADLHLPLKNGSDVWLFNGLLSFLHQHGVVDTAFVAAHTADSARALVIADNTAGDVRSVARACRLDAGALAEFYRLFARTERVVTMFSQGVNQSSSGTDKVNSIINCHLLSGRIGRPGMGPFSITGQPNAMGGREVGGLANMLAAHLELGDAAHRRLVQAFWRSPRIADQPGLKAVELFEAIEAGRVKAVWIMATNPVVSLPDADQVRAALTKCELVVVSDVVENTDTNAYAHILLPAAAWGEKDGTVTNSERRISRSRTFLQVPGEAKPDWWIIGEVARRMGFGEGFPYRSPAEIFDEHARLSAFGNAESWQSDGEGTNDPVTVAPSPRVFDLSGLCRDLPQSYDQLEPVQWPVLKGQEGIPPGAATRLFGDGKFATHDGRACFVATTPRVPAHVPHQEYPLALNTGRIRDQWHTMTRTGKSPKLASHLPEPYVDMHPQDALIHGVRSGELVRVATHWGAMVARLTTGGDQPRGEIFVPIHWNAQHASDGRVGALVNPVVDPISGEPEFKHTPARVEPFGIDWHGFVFTRKPLTVANVTWWTRIQGTQFIRYELAGRGQPDLTPGGWQDWGHTLLGVAETTDWLEYCDRSAGLYRAAHVVNQRIEACVFASPRPDLPSRAWLAGLFTKRKLDDIDRVSLLIGEPVNKQADTGPTVCSCFGVGRNTIVDAIRTFGLRNAGEVTARLKAGGNCGSCVPELRKLIAEIGVSQAA